MRDGWKKVAISDVCIMIKRGQAPSYTENKSVTVLNQKCIRDGRINLEFSRQTDANLKPINEWAYLNATDTLVNSTGVGTLGRVAFVRNLPEPTTVDSHVTIVRPDNKKVEPSFLGLSLNFREADIEGLAAGSSGQTELSREALGNLIITLPTLPEQKRIVDLISSVDSYVEALQQQLESAKRSRNAVLHELLTAGSVDWVETTLGEITDLVRGPFGGSLKKEIFVKEGFAVYEQQHAIYGDFSTIRYRVSSEKFDEMKRFSLVPGDLIMSCSGTMGKVRIVPKEADPGIINQALLKIKPKSNLSSDFLYLWMQSDDFIRQIEMNSGGGALQNVSSVKMLKGIKLRVPGLLEQERIIGIISMIDEVIIKTELAICEAKNLRSGLLSNLLNGDHEIPSSYDKVMGAA
jgi:type I restriction enzyme S subunit